LISAAVCLELNEHPRPQFVHLPVFFMRIFLFILLSTGMLFSHFSCTRKGEDDPLISLRTRKARVCGKWRLNEGDGYSAPSYRYTNVSWKYDAGTETYTNSLTGVEEGQQSFSCSVEFNSDQTFTWKMQEITNADPGVMKGTWDFLSASDYDKRKVKIVLNPQSISGTWPPRANLPFPLCESRPVFEIRELRTDKLVLFRNYTLPPQFTSSGLSPQVYESFTLIPQ
jgi:hypothetical protein